MKKVSTLLMMLVAFCGMAWAQGSDALPFKVSDAPTGDKWAENTTWYMIRSTLTNEGSPAAWLSTKGTNYVNNDGVLLLKNTNQPTDNGGLWCFVGNENDGYKVYNKDAGTSKVLGLTAQNNDAATAKMYAETPSPAGNVKTAFDFVKSTCQAPGLDLTKAGCFKLHGTQNMYWNNRKGSLGDHLAIWDDARAVSGKGSAFTFFEVNVDQAKTTLNAAIATAETWKDHIGTGLGQYSTPQGKNLSTLIADAKQAVQDGDYFPMISLTNELNTCVNGITINQPQTGRFYVFKNKASNRYIDGTTAKDNVATSEGKDAAGNLFFLTTDKKLLGYATGYYFINTRQIGKGTANTWEFLASTKNKGYYELKASASGSNGRYLFGWADTNKNHCDRNSGADNQGRTDWTIEEVTTLPVNVSNAGWASLYAPVALTIPENVTAYTGEVNGNKLVLTKVVSTIPANTPVLIEASEGKYNFTIDYNAAATATATAGKTLIGTIETIVKPQGNVFTLQNIADKGIGLYKYTGENLQGFRAYGLNLLGESSQAAGLSFYFGDVTAIEGVTADNDKQAEIYDLSGRRVAKAQKGIYIINGKKVVVK